MNNALNAYAAAKTEAELKSAYDALLEHVAEDMHDDADFESAADAVLENRGVQSYASKLNEILVAA